MEYTPFREGLRNCKLIMSGGEAYPLSLRDSLKVCAPDAVIGYAFMENGEERFSFPPGTTVVQQYKQFGNSVTIPVIEEMALFMLSCFDTMTKDQLELIIQMASNRDSITRRDVIELLRVSSNQAGYLLKKLVWEGKLRLIDTRKKAHYVLV